MFCTVAARRLNLVRLPVLRLAIGLQRLMCFTGGVRLLHLLRLLLLPVLSCLLGLVRLLIVVRLVVNRRRA